MRHRGIQFPPASILRSGSAHGKSRHNESHAATPRRISEWIHLGKFCLAHLAEARAAQMAAALSFRMLFGILPVLVVGTLVVKSVMGEEFPIFVTRMIEAAGMDGVSLVRPDVSDGGTTTVPLGSWVNEMVAYAASLNLAAIGWIGVGTVAFSAIWLLVAIEESFNIVCRAPRGRAWMRRVLVYWFLLTFGPLALRAPVESKWYSLGPDPPWHVGAAASSVSSPPQSIIMANACCAADPCASPSAR